MIIYLVTNLVNKKQYVGQTTQTLMNRWKHHCWSSTRKHNMLITKAITKYGKENFSLQIIEECETYQQLNEREVFWVNALNTMSPNGYNLRAGGGGQGIMAQETKDKISRANTGRKASPETREKLRQSHLGHKNSPETCRKMSLNNKGKRGSDLCYQKAIEALQKNYELVDPMGNSIYVTNMKDFCKKHNLSHTDMCEVVNGKRLHHKGWTGSIIPK